MSAIGEAVILPFIFLTVTLLAALELGTRVVLVPPSVFSLVLAAMLLAALVRSGALLTSRLLHGSRSALANANGAAVLVALFAASAQLLTLLTPRTGLPLFFVDLFLFVLLSNTLVAMPDRVRLLRSLAVILGAALVVKFVLLSALSGPSGSRLTRVLVALFDAGTFGTISQETMHPAAGYLAFVAVALFLIGVARLPHASIADRLQLQGPSIYPAPFHE